MGGNSNAISVRYAPVDGRRAAGQQKHDRRDPQHTPDYIDTSRSHLNTNKVEREWTAESIRQEIAAERKAAGMQKLRADASTLVTGIVTFGHDAQTVIEAMTPAEQDKTLERVIRDQAAASGHELLDWSVHRDEHATHAHFTLRGYSPEAKPWRKGILEMKQLQDVAAESVAHLGIERGNSKAARLASGENIRDVTHKSVKQLHEALPEEVAKLEAKLENLQRLYDQAQARLAAGAENEAALVKRLGVYEARIQKLEKQLEARPVPEIRMIEVYKGTEKGGFLKSPTVKTETIEAVDAEAFEEWRYGFINQVNADREIFNDKTRKVREQERELIHRENTLGMRESALNIREIDLKRREGEIERTEIKLGLRKPPEPIPVMGRDQPMTEKDLKTADRKAPDLFTFMPDRSATKHEPENNEPDDDLEMEM